MNKITQDMRFKQAVIEYSFKHGVTKAAIWLTRPVTILIFIPLKCVYTKFEEEPSTFMLLTSFTHSRIFKNSWPFISATITISLCVLLTGALLNRSYLLSPLCNTSLSNLHYFSEPALGLVLSYIYNAVIFYIAPPRHTAQNSDVIANDSRSLCIVVAIILQIL